MTEIAIAVVGHTNVGKTSLLRTLLRDSQFGEVSPSPTTTINVSAGSIVWDEYRLGLFDTPGLEDGIGLYEYLQQLNQRAQVRHQGTALLETFLHSPEASQSFEQEAKVIRQLQRSDAALYVIDVRDPVLPKYQDELAILSYSGRPILPILNFTAHPNTHQAAWQQALAEVNLHVWVAFDSVTPPQHGEAQIYHSLATVLPKHRSAFESLQGELTTRQSERQRAASLLIADALVDLAACRLHVAPEATPDAVVATLKTQVLKREQTCVDRLLALYNFDSTVIHIPALAMRDGRWENDLFNPHTLKQFGVSTSKRAAGGAAIGAGVDVVMLGTTLGAGTLLGATLGSAWQTWRSYGKRLRDALKGVRELSVEDAVLELFSMRMQQLAQHLDTRAHANATATQLDTSSKAHASVLDVLKQARAYPQWSSLSQSESQSKSEVVSAIHSAYRQLKPADYEERTELVDNLGNKLTLQRNASK